MRLVEDQQVGKTRKDHFTNVKPGCASIARLAVDNVVTYFTALSSQTYITHKYSRRTQASLQSPQHL